MNSVKRTRIRCFCLARMEEMKRLISKPYIEKFQIQLIKDVAAFKYKTQRPPKLCVLLVGEDPASIIYTNKKATTAKKLGFESENIHFHADTDPTEVKKVVAQLNQDPKVDGILIQRPLPKQFNEQEILEWVDPDKDVDGFHPINAGRLSLGLKGLISCTPLGVIELLKFYDYEFSGKIACVVGRSHIVGKPMAQLLLKENATLIQCHSHTKHLETWTRQADLLIVAAGKAKLIQPKHVKEGAVVVDVGIHRTENGKLCGDVDFESVSQIASAVTPVPGSVGPMTIQMLLANTLLAARRKESL